MKRGALVAAITVAVVVAILHIATAGQYDAFRNELYFLVCGRHPAFGYADQPPLVPLLLAITQIGGGERLAHAITGDPHGDRNRPVDGELLGAARREHARCMARRRRRRHGDDADGDDRDVLHLDARDAHVYRRGRIFSCAAS